MVTKIFKTALLAMVIGLTACNDKEQDTSIQGTGSIAAKIIWGDEAIQSKSADGPALAAITTNPVNDLPADLVTVRLTVEGNGITPISKTFNAADRTGTISGLPANETPYNLVVEGLNGASEVKYRDASTGATVTAGTVTSVNAYARSITQVVSTSPANVETGVSPLVGIQITFDTLVDPRYVGAGDITLVDMSTSTQVPGEVAYYFGGTFIVTFNPTDPLKDNTDYQVIISADLNDYYDNPLQTSFSWEFTTGVGKTWGAAELVETGDQGDALDPQIAIDSNGNAMAVWQQSDGTRNNVWTNRYTAGGSWGTPALIETDDTGDAISPQIAIDGAGDAIAVWTQHDGTRNNAWTNRYTAGSGIWGGPAKIEDDDLKDMTVEQIVIDANDNALVVGTSTSKIWSNRYTTGGGWGVSHEELGSVYTSSAPRIAVDVVGNAIAIWEESYSGAYEIISDHYTLNIGWGGKTRITSTTYTERLPQITFDGAGNALALWRVNTPDIGRVEASLYALGGDWGNTQEVSPTNFYNSPSDNHQVASDGNGNMMAVWQQGNGTTNSIVSRSYTMSNGWGASEGVESADGNAINPQIAFDANGQAIAVWEQSTNLRNSIWVNHYNAGWKTPVLLETNDVGHAFSPQIAVNANGDAVVTWYQSDGTRNNIYASSYK
ncbi:MAG: Ig-like domain-containing protein [Gammaproteobacteria bacterium]|nr:Ig-like domain-containing protein [Gammaproteobacteria bacterium]MCK5262104.1 Ig-like domain-containing protein [Gammaproteobacteria bacterium]